MSFNDEVLKDGRGRVIRIDASIDKFASVSYRWGDAAGVLDGTNQYSSRILSVAPVRRGLGENRVAGGGTCEVVLANADGLLDALAGREFLSTQAKLRFRIYVCLYTIGADPLVFTSKLLGEFSLTSWIRQGNETLTLSLGDDVMGAVAQQAALPTFNDWHGVGTAATNPLIDGFGLPDSETEYTPIQLAFGEDWVLAHPHVLPFGGLVDAAYNAKIIVPVCCTTDTGAASSTEIVHVRALWRNGNSGTVELRDIPSTVIRAGITTTVWTIERSPTITKDGKNFKIIYLVVRNDLGCVDVLNNYLTGGGGLAGDSGGYNPTYDSPQFTNEWIGNYSPSAIYQQRTWAANDPRTPQYASFGAGVLAWYVKGVPLSARTQTTAAIQHPVDVLTDLVDYYSNGSSITVDTTMGARVKAATAATACAGTVQPWTSGPRRGDPVFQQPPSLRQVITAICQSADIDAFIDWSGQFSFSCDLWDFRIATSGTASWTPDAAYQTSGNGTTTSYIPTVIPETWLMDGIERWVPSDGERWAPYNRLWLNGGRPSPGDGVETVPYQGPWDFDTYAPSSIALTDRIVEATFEQGWRPYRQQAFAPWFGRSGGSVARDMVRFRTHIGGLQLELGQYFALTWTRGTVIAGPYSGTIFQCEAITYAPGDDTVEVTAVWRDDVTSEQQYLLDDETLLAYADITITATATSDGAGRIDFATGTGIDIVNLLVGAILVLKDTTQAEDVFTRFGAWRITTVDPDPGGPYVLVAVNGEGDYPVAGAVASGQWHIEYGATDYASNYVPVSYLLGGDVYGKVTDSVGEYSNTSTGNRLNSG